MTSPALDYLSLLDTDLGEVAVDGGGPRRGQYDDLAVTQASRQLYSRGGGLVGSPPSAPYVEPVVIILVLNTGCTLVPRIGC